MAVYPPSLVALLLTRLCIRGRLHCGGGTCDGVCSNFQVKSTVFSEISTAALINSQKCMKEIGHAFQYCISSFHDYCKLVVRILKKNCGHHCNLSCIEAIVHNFLGGILLNCCRQLFEQDSRFPILK